MFVVCRCFAACEEWEEVMTILATPKADTSSPLRQKRFSEEDCVKAHEVGLLAILTCMISVREGN